jgi:Pyruvate/2-oxoacid:ferredoxin oxidoreductase delta subunit
MCEFCVQHGEGKKWYLQAKNYSQDLLSDARRRGFIKDFFSHPESLGADQGQMAKLAKLPPFAQRMVKSGATRKMKKQHFGQVLPLEDVREIFGFVTSITRVNCICRYSKLGREARYCYGVAMGRSADAFGEILAESGQDVASNPLFTGVEQLTTEQAAQAFADHEKEGLCHTVWTFGTPFIGGICNCDRSDCLAINATVTHDVKVMFRAEVVAESDPELCTGCRSCMRLCPFGALGFGAATRKVTVDQSFCYGCGICRSACAKNAITMRPRSEVATVASLW